MTTDFEQPSNIREIILAAAADQAKDLIYYDRKEDEELPRGAIQDAIQAGQITVEEIVVAFRAQLIEWMW